MKNKISFANYINSKIIERFNFKDSIIFGQNVIAGSRISGLGRGLDSQDKIIALNTPNSENTLMGFGLGLMISGVDSAFIMKQHDFALLGLDQLTNTVNSTRTYLNLATFLVIMVVVDSGFEGPQASLNNLDEFASLSRSPVHFLNNKEGIDRAFNFSRLGGFRMFALSQKNLKSDLLSLSERGITQSHKYGELVQKSKESKLLIIFFGLDLTYLFSIEKEFNSEGEEVDMFIVSHLDSHISIDENLISSYDSILILDTSKAEVTYSRELAQTVLKTCSRTLFLGRKSSDLWSTVNVDQPEIDPSEVVNRWRQLGKE